MSSSEEAVLIVSECEKTMRCSLRYPPCESDMALDWYAGLVRLVMICMADSLKVPPERMFRAVMMHDIEGGIN